MDKPEIAQKSPLELQVEANKNYAWCACGKSQNQPLCDGSHKGTGMMPTLVKFDEAKSVWFCCCKQTDNKMGLCDGTHNNL